MHHKGTYHSLGDYHLGFDYEPLNRSAVFWIALPNRDMMNEAMVNLILDKLRLFMMSYLENSKPKQTTGLPTSSGKEMC